ncbi:hypothetical protein V7056_13655 [Bacillus sp. JJ664]
MIVNFSKKHLVHSLLGVLLTIGLILYGYFIVINPIKDETNNLISQIKLQEKVLNNKQTSSTGKTTEVNTSDTSLLQKELPVKPLEEQILLYLEKAEAISKVNITSISSGNSQVDDSQLLVGELQNNDGSETQANDQNNEASTSKQVNEVSYNLEVAYSYYEELHDFLTELEHSARILQIDSLTISRDENETTSVVPIKSTASMVIKAFYVPNLKELTKQDPTVEIPTSCEKRTNPVEIQDCKE